VPRLANSKASGHPPDILPLLGKLGADGAPPTSLRWPACIFTDTSHLLLRKVRGPGHQGGWLGVSLGWGQRWRVGTKAGMWGTTRGILRQAWLPGLPWSVSVSGTLQGCSVHARAREFHLGKRTRAPSLGRPRCVGCYGDSAAPAPSFPSAREAWGGVWQSPVDSRAVRSFSPDPQGREPHPAGLEPASAPARLCLAASRPRPAERRGRGAGLCNRGLETPLCPAHPKVPAVSLHRRLPGAGRRGQHGW
jgi:hypothetical protein